MKNQIIVNESQQLLYQIKNEIALELGITPGGDISSRDNGRIGGEMVKRLIEMAKNQL